MTGYNFYNIDGVNVPFNTHWNSVALSVSGGADSALLAYLVCDMAKDHNITVHIINHVRCWKTKPWQKYDGDRVYNWLFQRFYHTTFKRHTNFIAPELEYANLGPTLVDEYGKSVSGDNIEQRAFAEFVCYTENCDAYYNAVTRNPSSVDFVGMAERDIEPSEHNRHLEIMQHMGKLVSHPFRFVEKDWVVRQYKRLGIEDLFEITRSCEGQFQDLNYLTYTPGQHVPTCGECFWCKEREWAIEQSK